MASKTSQAAIQIVLNTIKTADYSKTQTVKLAKPFVTDTAKALSISLNQGIVNLSDTARSNVEGKISFTGKAAPSVSVFSEQGYEIFKIVQPDQNPQKQDIQVPTTIRFEEVNIGIGAGFADIDISHTQTANLNLGMGAGEAVIKVPTLDSSRINLSSGAGNIKIIIPTNLGFKVKTTEDVTLNSIKNTKYHQAEGSYVSNNYEASKIKVEIMTAQIGSLDITSE